MALGSFVYLSNVNNLSDARYAAGIGVDLVGFRLNPNDGEALNPEQFKEIAEWISGVKIAGEFGDSSAAEVGQYLKNYELDYLMIADASQLHAFAELSIPLILKIHIQNETKDQLTATLNYCSGIIDYFVLESDHDRLDQGEKEIIKTYASQFPILLGYGVNSTNAKSIVDELNLKGISLKGQSEIRPGYKDFDEMADILEVLEVD